MLTEDCADQLAEEHYDTPSTELLLVEETLQESRGAAPSPRERERREGSLCRAWRVSA